MNRSLIYYGNPLLRRKAIPVAQITDEIREIIRQMQQVVRAHPAWGLAAAQLGFPHAIFLLAAQENPEDIECPDTRIPARVFINPKLSLPSKEEWSQGE